MWFIFPFLSALSVTFLTLIQKWTLQREHALQFTTTMGLTLIPVSLLLLPYINFKIPIKIIPLIILSSCLIAGAVLCHSKAIRHYEVSSLSPFYNLGTAYVAIFAVLFLGETLSIIQMLGITLLICGTYVIGLKGGNIWAPVKNIIKSSQVHLILLAVFLYSSTYLVDKVILETLNPFTLFFYRNLIATSIFLFLIFTFYKGFADIKKGFAGGKGYFILMALLALAETLLIYEGMKLAPVSLVVPIYRTWTLFVVIIGGEFYHEKNLLPKIAATIIMILGAYLVIR